MDTYRKKLAESGLSDTKPRQAIFNILKNSGHQPFTMNQLIFDCKAFADRSTVYRSVKSLEKAGIIKKIYQGWKYKIELADDFHGHHHHAICNKCKKILELQQDPKLENILNSVASSVGFTMTDHDLEISGLCNDCALKPKPRSF